MKPFITRGDNYANLLLPGLSLVAIIITFIAGLIFQPKKDLLITNRTQKNFSKITTNCENTGPSKLKADDQIMIATEICEDTLLLKDSDIELGECKIPPFDYQEIRITIESIPFGFESCLFIK